MKRKTLLLMLLMALFSGGAWAQFSGSGTESDPYLISSSSDWSSLASKVNGGTNYSGKYFRLTSNITISGSTQAYMVGTMSGETNSGYAFSGNFNGDGHTITISYSTSSGFYYTAPFRYISGATIKNVKVAGTMNVYKFMGSLVGYCMGTNNIENCVSEVAITGTISGDATMGGLISHVHGGTTNIRGCVFKGKLLGSSSNSVGGFIGWTDHGSADSYFYDCVFAPSEVTVSTTSSATFSRGNSSNTSGISVYNSYYTQTHGTTQGSKLQYTITAGSNVSTVALGNNPVEYNLSGITGYNSSSGYGIKYNNTIYAASGNSVKLNLSSTLTNPQYSASPGSLSGTSNPYTLSMTSSSSVISATDGGSGGGGGDGDCTEIGTGTSTTGYAPIYGNYKSSYAQMIYTASQLQDAGITEGSIIKIGFNSKSSNTYSRNPVIYMCTTSKSSFNSDTDFIDFNSLTKVYDYSNNHSQWNITSGWNEFELDTPFKYDGQSNIVIAMYCSLASYYASSEFYYTSTSNNQTIYARNDNTNADPYTYNNNWSNYSSRGMSTYLPNVRLCIEVPTTETCEDFESVSGASTAYNSQGSLPTGWDNIYGGTVNSTTANAPHVHNGSSYPGTVSSEYYLGFYCTSNYTNSYAIMPAAASGTAVNHLSFKYKYENTSYGTLTYGVISGTSESSYIILGTCSTSSNSVDVDLDITQTYGKRIAFRYSYSSSWYTAGIDDVCVTTTSAAAPTFITEIATVADWEAFCAAVNGGHDYSDETVHLRGPVSITSQDNQAGASGKYFQGTFEGHGNTITVNMTATGDNCAPFYGLQAATINDLIVTGSISSTYGRAAGISGTIENQDGSVGDCTFNNCISNVAITSSGGTCGGFIGHSGGYTNPTFVGCAFTGSINATAGDNYACFIGFHVSRTGWQTPYICTSHFTNCICAPSSISVNGAESATIVCGYNGGAYLLKEIENSYYNEEAVTLSTKQGTRAYTVTGASPVNVERSGDANTTYDVSGIAAYTGSTNKGLNFTQGTTTTIYAGSGETVALTLSGASTYEADHGTLTHVSDNNWSLAMGAYDTKISAIACATPTAFTYTALGSTYVTLTWTAGDQEDEWEVKYWANGTAEPADGQASIVNPRTITGLTLGVAYHAKVRAVCDAQNGEYSEWVQCDFTTSSKTFTNNSTFGDHNWSDPSNWNPIGVPTTDDDVTIAENATIGNGVLAQAHNITNNATITIADGGQLWHNNTGVNLTIERAIPAYHQENEDTNLGYKIISFPVSHLKPNSPYITGLLTSDPYDFYTFDYTNQGEDDRYLEWMHVSTNDGLDPNMGYLYASQNGTTISVTGAVAPSVNQDYYLDYEEGDAPFNGWKLVSNPFVCNAYLTAQESHMDFYEIKDYNDYAEFFPIDDAVEIPPMGGVMVRVKANDNLVYSRTEPNSKGPGILNMDVNKASMRGTTMLDRARVRFGEGRNLKKLQLNPRHTKLYIPEGGNDFSVYYAEGAGTIPVNFKAQDNGRYTLSFSTEDVSFNYLHLIDNMNGNDVDLLQTPYYTFDAKSTDFASRFTLVFATGSSTGSDTFAFFNNGVWIINNPSTGSEAEATLQVVDVLGHILSSETISGSCSKAINVAPGVYMLRLINGDKVKVQKIVVRR